MEAADKSDVRLIVGAFVRGKVSLVTITSFLIISFYVSINVCYLKISRNTAECLSQYFPAPGSHDE